jgi:hypothetical protein
MHFSERYEKYYGVIHINPETGGLWDVEASSTGEGWVFKDYEAFERGTGVCYIGEYDMQDMTEELTALEARYENSKAGEDGYLTDEEYEAERERIIYDHAETRQTIIDQVREMYAEDYMLTDKQIEHIAAGVFNEADWACIATYLTGDFWLDDDIIADEGNDIYTYHQYEAVMNDMTPKEYADRQLSYGELAVLDEEFDTAFIVDEDCEDDWSDKGLGANARITYIEERRTGIIDRPEQFDCPPQFVRK